MLLLLVTMSFSVMISQVVYPVISPPITRLLPKERWKLPNILVSSPGMYDIDLAAGFSRSL